MTNHDVRDMEAKLRDERLVQAAERGRAAAQRLSRRLSVDEVDALFAARQKRRK